LGVASDKNNWVLVCYRPSSTPYKIYRPAIATLVCYRPSINKKNISMYNIILF